MQVIKDRIETMPKNYQVEVGRILINAFNVSFDENQNGIFINLSTLSPDIIIKLEEFIKYVDVQESYLNIDENEKHELKDTFFTK